MSKPSEKAMQFLNDAAVIQANLIGASIEEQYAEMLKVAERIDAHTAEALTEHKRVIEMAEKALAQAEFHLAVYDMKLPTITEALAEIAKLRKE
jgi:predicted aldo/keto reductase-like oxidoreductase